MFFPEGSRGWGAEAEEAEDYRQCFIRPLVDIVFEAGVSRRDESKTADKEYRRLLTRRARRLCRRADICTSYRAVTAATESGNWAKRRAGLMGLDTMEVIVLEKLVWQGEAWSRVVAAGGLASQ